MASGSGEEVGVAFVRLVPSMRGFGPEAQNALNDATRGPASNAGEEAGGRFSGAFKAATAAGVGLAVGALVAGVGEALDQGKITAKLGAQLGATPAEAKRYGQIAGDLYSNAVTEDFQGAADAIKATMSSGLLPPEATNKQIEGMSTKVADLANNFDQDLGGVTRAVSKLLTTGLAKNADEAFDLITTGFSTSANQADDFLDTINEYSVQFKRVGLDGKTAIGLIDQAIDAGARDSDQVADAIGQFGELALSQSSSVQAAFKSIGLNSDEIAAKLQKGGKSGQEALQLTTDALRNTTDKTVRLNAATALFGDPGTVMGDALFALDPAGAAASSGMDKAKGSTDKLGDSVRNNAAVQVDKLQRKLKQGFVEFLGNEVIPKVQDFVGWLKDNKDTLEAVGLGIATVVVPALIALGVQSLIAAVRMAAAWVVALGPIGWIGLAIGALAILVFTYWDEIKAWTLDAWDWVAGKVSGAVGAVLDAVGWLAGLPGLVGGFFSDMKTRAVDLVISWVDWLTGLPGMVWDAISGLATTLWNVATSAFANLRNAAALKVVGLIDWASGIPKRVAGAIGSEAYRLYNMGLDFVTGLWDGIAANGGWLWSKVRNFVSNNVVDPVKSFLHIGSPSKLMADEVGQWIPAGIAEGWESGIPKLETAAQRTTSAAMTAAAGSSYGATSPGGARVVIDGSGMPSALLEWLRSSIRVEGGGDVQGYLGQAAG